ncbi:MAG: response regulator, partial [Lachnospiraceae bacterium]|nr:response regulator [Lachnospiraceae bacterium]
MKVVIVDDDPLVASSLKIILEQDQEIQVCATCTSGREAVKLVTQSDLSPDIMLMDIRMDDMNGLEAAEQIMAENKGI